MKELQNAFKNPTANLGLILEEASKRVGRKVGLSSPPSMDHLVHKDLADSAKLLAKVTTHLHNQLVALSCVYFRALMRSDSR